MWGSEAVAFSGSNQGCREASFPGAGSAAEAGLGPASPPLERDMQDFLRGPDLQMGVYTLQEEGGLESACEEPRSGCPGGSGRGQLGGRVLPARLEALSLQRPPSCPSRTV